MSPEGHGFDITIIYMGLDSQSTVSRLLDHPLNDLKLLIINTACYFQVNNSESIKLTADGFTFPKDPFPRTMRKLKSVARMRSLPFMLCGTRGSCFETGRWYSDGRFKKVKEKV